MMCQVKPSVKPKIKKLSQLLSTFAAGLCLSFPSKHNIIYTYQGLHNFFNNDVHFWICLSIFKNWTNMCITVHKGNILKKYEYPTVKCISEQTECAGCAQKHPNVSFVIVKKVQLKFSSLVCSQNKNNVLYE